MDPHYADLFARGDLWMVLWTESSERVYVQQGSYREMLDVYENLAISWTGVVLSRVVIPDANMVAGGVAHEAFNALRAPTDPEKEFRRWVVATMGAEEYQQAPAYARDLARAAFMAGRSRRIA